MTEVHDATSTETNVEEILMSGIPSSNIRQHNEEALTALFLKHLDKLQKQTDKDETIQKEVNQFETSQIEMKSAKLLNLIQA